MEYWLETLNGISLSYSRCWRGSRIYYSFHGCATGVPMRCADVNKFLKKYVGKVYGLHMYLGLEIR